MAQEVKYIVAAAVCLIRATSLVHTLAVYKGDQAKLDCPQIESLPKWSKILQNSTLLFSNQDNPIINPALPHKDRLSIDSKGRLVINDTERSDAGIYNCSYAALGTHTIELQVNVIPAVPEIFNKEISGNGQTIIRGKEDQVITLTCLSSGGYPQPTVQWSTTSSVQPSTTTVTTATDGTYNVTIRHEFTAVKTDDRVTYFCKTLMKKQEDLVSSVMLYLSLKPSQPVISGPGIIPENNSGVYQCKTDGCRPQASIHWRYNGSISKPSVSSYHDQSLDTYTMESNYSSGPLRRNDNNEVLVCVVSHEALPNNIQMSLILNITFSPMSVTLSGNDQIVANGSNRLELTCTASTANPPATLQWLQVPGTLPQDITRTLEQGDYKGKVVSEKLTLLPTRDMDGAIISCAFNKDVRDEIALNLTYSPLTTIEGMDSRTVHEGEKNILFICSADSKPVSNFTWYHNGYMVGKSNGQQATNQHNYILPEVKRTSFGNITCRADNNVEPKTAATVTLSVLFFSTSVMLSGNSQIVANGQTPLELTCTAGTANPAATLQWRHGETPINDNITRSISPGMYGGKIVTERLTLIPTRYMDGDVIFCSSQNMKVSSETTLNLTYNPIVTVPRQVNATEGETNVTLKCSAESKPPSVFKWLKSEHDKLLHEGSGTADNNVLEYVIPVVNRTDDGLYRCTAYNGIGTPDHSNNELVLHVYYPPSITVKTTNTTVNASKVEIICEADGVPKTCNFTKWNHSWEGVTTPIRTELQYLITGTPTQQILTITSPSYEDTGIYTCGASNGVIRWETKTYEMVNSVYLLVKSYPIVTSEEHNKGPFKITPKLNIQFAFSVQFYSNADNTKAFLYKKINATMDNNITYERVNNASLDIKGAEVELTVHGQPIRTSGYRLTLNHTIYNYSEYGLYVLGISNDVGTREVFFDAIPESVPYTPVFPQIDAAVTSITVSWVRGFHGGFSQTFVIQYRENGYPWTNGTSRDDNLSTDSKRISSTISSLKPSTTYYIRMFAFNLLGRSEFTETLNTTTRKKAEDKTASPNVGLIAGGAVGGVVLAAIFVVLVIFFLRRRQAYLKSPSKSLLKDNKSPPGTKGTDDTPEINLNPMYESAGPLPSTSNSSDVYSQVDKNRKKEKSVGDIYSQVDKPKKSMKGDVYAQVKKQSRKERDADKTKQKKQKPLKKSKQERQAQGDLYDNVDIVNSTGTKEDTVYENPSCSVEDERPKQVRNNDGLIYAVLDLRKETDGKDRKNVIHGLDDRTDYADIKFGEVGEQAPESDEDNKQE